MTPEQLYAQKHRCKRLTFDGVNDLWLTPHGAHTLTDAIDITALYLTHRSAAKTVEPRREVEMSAEMYTRHERCIDKYGVGMYC